MAYRLERRLDVDATKKGHLAELNSDLGVASDGPSKVLTIITAKLDAADRMLLLACLRITSTVVRR